MLAPGPVLTFVQPYGSCTQVDIGLDAHVGTKALTTYSVGLIYISYWIYIL